MRKVLSLFRPHAGPGDLRIGARDPQPGRAPKRVRTMLDARAALAVEMAGETGIAILPFTDLTPHPDHPYLADGFARDLAQVISLNPTFFAETINVPYDEWAMEGAAIPVRHNLLLEGAIGRRGRTMAVIIRVVECSSGEILWSDRFSGPLEHIAILQDDIAEAVAGAVTSTPYFLHVDERPAGIGCAAAWALRRAARSLLHVGPDPSCLEGAVRLLSLASRLDPLYVDAKIGLAETLSLRPLLLATPDPAADRKRRDKILDAAEVLAPSHEELPFIRGLKELDSDRPSKAALALGRSIRVSAIMIPARIFLSIAEARSGRGRAARSDAAIAFKRAGRPGWTALADYALAEAALARGTVHEAESAVDAAITAAGGPGETPPLVLLLRSLLFAEDGSWEPARALLAEYWPRGLPLPAPALVRPWLAALPGKFGRGKRWLDDVIGPLSRGN